MTRANYADDLALLANTPAESLLHNQEQTARGIGLDLNANEAEFMYS